VRFCASCGSPASLGASFCSACGLRLAGEPAPPRAGGLTPAPLAGLIVLVGFLTVGLALWVVLLSPGRGPERMPLAKPSGEPPAQAASGGGMPANHPPLEIPADVKGYVADLEKKAEAAPKDVAAWRAVAQVEYRAGQIDRSYLDKAEKSFRHLLELDGKDLDALRGLGNVHYDREEYPQAIEAFARYLEQKPEDAGVRTDLGTMYLNGGDAERAVVEYEKVLAKDPKFYQAHYNLGIAYAQQGAMPKTLEALGRAKELAPDDAIRKQIQATIDRVSGSPGSTSPAGAAPGGPRTLQAIVEDALRTHPIVGPKIVKFEWSSPTAGQLRLREFPMDGMPEMVRTKFLDRLKGQLADAKRQANAAGAAKLDLVDDGSGQVMASVTAE